MLAVWIDNGGRPAGEPIAGRHEWSWLFAAELLTTRIGSRKDLFPIPKARKEDMVPIRQLIEAGRYRAVIDGRYPWSRLSRRLTVITHGVQTNQRAFWAELAP
jgi:hypothetical protein